MNPFGNLSYSQKIQTYVGLPIERMKETGDVLQGKYTAAKENKSKLDIAIAQIDLDEKDEHIRGAAKEQLNLLMNPFKEKGNWEDAAFTVQQGATDVATNGGLLAATKSKQQELKDDAALQARVDNDKLLDTDKEFAQEEAKKNYTGVYKDEKTGAWKGGYKIVEPPDYINVGDYTDNFLKGFEADQWMGRYQKNAEGKWYVGEETGAKTVDGAKIYMPTTKEATFEEVYEAARSQVLQNEEIQERLDFELKKGNITYADKIAADAGAKKAMRHELTKQGYTKTQLDKMSDQELTDIHTRETLIHNGVNGPALKHSYEQVSTKSMGDSWDFITYKNKLAAAAAGGGNKETVTVEKNHFVLKTALRKPNGMPFTVEDHSKSLTDMTHQLELNMRTVKTYRKEINEYEKAGKAVPEALEQKLANAIATAEERSIAIRNHQKFYNQAKDIVQEKNGVVYDNIDKEFENLNKAYESTPEAATDAKRILDIGREIYSYMYPGVNPDGFWLSHKNIINSKGDRDAASAIVRQVINMQPGNLIFANTPEQERLLALRDEAQEIYEKNDRFMGETPFNPRGYTAAGHYLNAYVQILPKKAAIDLDVAEEYTKLQKNKSVNYAYVEMSTTQNKSGDPTSTYSKSASDMIRRNAGSFRVLTEEGKTMSWMQDGKDGLMNNGKWNLENITVLGPTMDYIHGKGYGYVAVEQLVDENGKKTGGSRQLVITEEGSSALQVLTLQELKKGMLLDADGLTIKGTGNKGYDEADDYVYKMQYQEVDKQMSVFQLHPPVPPKDAKTDKETFSTEIVISASKRAKVTRNTYHDSSTDYDIEVWDVSTRGNKGSTQFKTNKGYDDLFDVELVLEQFQGYGQDNAKYKVPLKTLQDISNTDLPYGKIAGNMQSMPKLVKPFKDEFFKLSKAAKKDFTITSMTRSEGLNLRYNGAKESGHLYGKGIDISLKDRGGKDLETWLKTNSEPYGNGSYRKVKGYDIIYDVHDRGSGEHIDMKWLEE